MILVTLFTEMLAGPYYVLSYHPVFPFITLITIYNQILFSMYHRFYYDFMSQDDTSVINVIKTGP